MGCVKNPPGYAGQDAHGLVNALEAVKRHLPRADGDPTKIRKGAALTIIVASDEGPSSLSAMINAPTACKLSSAEQDSVDKALKPYLSLFSGASDPEGTATLHVLGGVCGNTCNADVAHGYRELARELGGQVGDICQTKGGLSLMAIMDSVVGRASPLKLDRHAIGASLAMTLNGQEVGRSRTAGFSFSAADNTVVLHNVKFVKGDRLIVSYNRWRLSLMCC